ncbi:MAG: gliding motility-associated C-terminal domain-containing protein [Muribaculaceae bacterium]|nr:gliding motility-associated C-terminal domain-containing protein [Muribaculaceae bacterium]
MMNRNVTSIAILSLFLSSFTAFGYNVKFEGASKKVVEVATDKNTGLDAVFVGYTTKEISKIEISGITGTVIDVEKYSNLGGGYAEEIPFTFSGGTIIIENPQGNLGYIVKTENGNYCFWLVDYSTDPLKLEGVLLDSEQECETTALHITGKGGEIHYFTINGQQRTLSREIKLRYSTLEWDEEQYIFSQVNEEKILPSITGKILLTPPFYCATSVEVTGDRFLQEWQMSETIESEVFPASAVSVESRAEQTNLSDEEGSNIIKTETEGLGGSAPADITFYGYITDGVLHTEWQMASDPEFEYILFRFNEQDVSYSFTEEGRYYMRFIGSDADGSCESVGETYTIMIGASDLRIPNAFSPNDDGINDVWKVGYRSLVDFKCWIFDSKGTQLYQFEDPSGGWDGKYRGKTVNPGVYYYVIQATGADGKKYKKSGDINILNYKKYGSSTGEIEE